MQPLRFLERLLKGLVFWLLALLLLFEEWGWAPLARCFAALGRLPVWRQLESLILRLPPWAALLAFGVPVLALIPVKLLALFLLGEGHIGTGLGLIVAAKLLGTALAARLFQLTQPALLQIGWFARLYRAWKNWKDPLLRQVRCSLAWRLARHMRQRSSRWLRQWLATARKAFSGFQK